MSAQDFLTRCEGVRKTGPDRWLAKCPAHEDSKPSLNVKDVGGKLLVICRAGCSLQQILDATGLPWSVLFEAPNGYAYVREAKKAFPASDVLQALEIELLVISIVASDIKEKREVKEADYDRMQLAISRIIAAKDMTIANR